MHSMGAPGGDTRLCSWLMLAAAILFFSTQGVIVQGASATCPDQGSMVSYITIHPFDPIGSSGGLSLLRPTTFPPSSLCVSAQDSSSAAALQTGSCGQDDGSLQRFRISKVSTDASNTDWYQLQLVQTTLCWQAALAGGGLSATSITLAECDNSVTGQLFSIPTTGIPFGIDVNDSQFAMVDLRPMNDPGMCVRVPGSSLLSTVVLKESSAASTEESSNGSLAAPQSASTDGTPLQLGDCKAPPTLGFRLDFAWNLSLNTYIRNNPCPYPATCDNAPAPFNISISTDGQEVLKQQGSKEYCVQVISTTASGPCADMSISSIQMNFSLNQTLCSTPESGFTVDGVTFDGAQLSFFQDEFGNIQVQTEDGSAIASAGEFTGAKDLCFSINAPDCQGPFPQVATIFDPNSSCCPIFTPKFLVVPAESPPSNYLAGFWKGTCQIHASVNDRGFMFCDSNLSAWIQDIKMQLHITTSAEQITFAATRSTRPKNCAGKDQCRPPQNCTLPPKCNPGVTARKSACGPTKNNCDKRLFMIEFDPSKTLSLPNTRTLGCLTFQAAGGAHVGRFTWNKDSKSHYTASRNANASVSQPARLRMEGVYGQTAPVRASYMCPGASSLGCYGSGKLATASYDCWLTPTDPIYVYQEK